MLSPSIAGSVVAPNAIAQASIIAPPVVAPRVAPRVAVACPGVPPGARGRQAGTMPRREARAVRAPGRGRVHDHVAEGPEREAERCGAGREEGVGDAEAADEVGVPRGGQRPQHARAAAERQVDARKGLSQHDDAVGADADRVAPRPPPRSASGRACGPERQRLAERLHDGAAAVGPELVRALAEGDHAPAGMRQRDRHRRTAPRPAGKPVAERESQTRGPRRERRVAPRDAEVGRAGGEGRHAVRPPRPADSPMRKWRRRRRRRAWRPRRGVGRAVRPAAPRGVGRAVVRPAPGDIGPSPGVETVGAVVGPCVGPCVRVRPWDRPRGAVRGRCRFVAYGHGPLADLCRRVL